MTETLVRPPVRPEPRSRRGPDLLLAGIPAATWAVLAGLLAVAVPVLLVWAGDSRSGAGVGDALRTVVRLWLVAHGTALHVPGGTLDLLPLGLLALPLGLLARAGRHAAARHPVSGLRAAARLTAEMAVPYAVAVAVLGRVVATDQVRPSTLQALLGALLVAFAGASVGVLRGAGLLAELRAALPPQAARVLTGAAGAVATLVAFGAASAGVSLAVHLPVASDLATASGAGVVGGLGLLVLGAVLAPTAAVWGACWYAGPGFSVGTGTSVGPFGTHLSAVPAVPVLAALPSSSPPGWAAALLLLVPVAAGVVAGLLVRRRGGGLADALMVAPAAGLGLALLAALSAGSLGAGRLAELGPSAWRVGLTFTVAVAVGALPAVLLRRRRS